MMERSELWLIRHGESTGNQAHVLQGQADMPLSERGRRQAVALAKRLSSLGGFSAIYSSDLSRAWATALETGAELGMEPVADARLREIDIGTWSGLTLDEIQERFPDEFRVWQERDPDLRRGQGESYAEAGRRMATVCSELAQRHPGGRILVISHGGVIRTYVSLIMGLDLRHLWHLSMANTGISRIRPFAQVIQGSQPRQGRIICLNDQGHCDHLP